MEEGGPREDGECGCLECRPQVFTSVLLGILSCVLVTGGVFLAFHKWDHTWLLVSAVGVVLIIIGTILHCCSSSDDQAVPQRGSHKGRPHVIPCGAGDNVTLTEQLLPLSNARSVSQLSLNMVPSYFPAYSIEQHSAVVQNINRIVQGSGKSFLLLPIPADASPAQLQNLMASVCQLDGSASTEESSGNRDAPTTEASSQATDLSLSRSSETLQRQETASSTDLPASPTQTSSPVRIVKHAEVQTCCDWQVQRNLPSSTSDIIRAPTVDAATTSSVAETQVLLLDGNVEEVSASLVCLNVATEGDVEVAGSTEDASVGGEVVEIVSEVSVPCSSTLTEQTTPLVSYDIPITTDTACESTALNISGELVDISTPSCVPQVVVATEVFEDASSLDVVTVQTTSAEEPTIQPVTDASQILTVEEASALPPPPQNIPELGLLGADACSITSDLLDSATEIEDSESVGRSSPPPSYDDVTQENQMILGAFGLAYGTI